MVKDEPIQELALRKPAQSEAIKAPQQPAEAAYSPQVGRSPNKPP